MNSNPFMQRYEEEDAVDAIEMAPSDTSYDQQQQSYMQHTGSKSNLNQVQNPQIINPPQVMSNTSSQKSLQNQSQVVFPPRQFPQQQQQLSNFAQPQIINPSSQQLNNQLKHNFNTPQQLQQQQQYQLNQQSNSKERLYGGQLGDQSQSMLNLSDSVDQNSNIQNAHVFLSNSNNFPQQQPAYLHQQQQPIGGGGLNPNNTSLISNQSAQNTSGFLVGGAQNAGGQQQSALVRQLSEKVRSQAERLQKLESYKQLIERRLAEIDPKHPLPVLPQHLGQKSFSIIQPELPPSAAEMKRQLAIKEQDLQYAKQRNEKLVQEIENLKRELEEKPSDLDTSQKIHNQSQTQKQNLSKSGSFTNNNTEVQEALRKEIQLNEQLQKQLEILKQGNILDKIKQLEDEKNALLDYIEDNIEKSHANTQRSAAAPNIHNMREESSNSLQDKVKQLEYEKSKLFQMCENLKHSEESHKQRVADLESELKKRPSIQDLNDLREQLEQIQSRYTTKCEDYSSLIKQIDPHFNENTFGGPPASHVDDLQQKLLGINTLQKELDFSKEQFESTIGNVRKEKEQLKQRIEELESENMEMEERIRRSERDKEEIRARAKEQYQGESERVDELIYENDNLRKEIDRLQQRLKTLQENSTTLQDTLNETQQEFENLVNEHEKLSQMYQRQRNQADQLENERDRYKQLNSESDKELLKLRNEIVELRKETARQREDLSANSKQMTTLNDQLYRADMDNRDLKHQLSTLQHELGSVQTHQQVRIDKQAKDWEQTIGDLTRELNYVQGELTEKENIFQRVEQELRNKLLCLEEVTQEKSELRRRIEDMQSELRHIQTVKAEKEEKLKSQIHKNEQLLEELERINEAYTTAKDEKEATLVVKVEKEKQIEYTQRQLQKMSKVADRSLKSLKSLSKSLVEFSLEMKFKPAHIINAPSINHEQSHSTDKQENMEPILLDIEQHIHHLTEATNIITTQFKTQNKSIIDLKSENLLTLQKLQQIEMRYKSMSEEEIDVRERMRFMESELDQLREKLRNKEEEKKEQYQREEKIQRQNQQVKQQLESCRKEQEKLLMQIKSLLVEKERMVDEIKQRQELSEGDMDRCKQLEVKLANVFQQKETILNMLERIRDGMPTDSLQRLLHEIIDCLHETFRLEEDYQQLDQHLLQMEGELRAYSKKEGQGMTLLSTKVINLRKDVESKRVQLREVQEQKELIKNRRESLEQELKCTELSERRRCDVALETEKTLTEAKFEISNLKRELQFVNTNRKDLEVALSSVQEEKKMIERELLSLRAQLQMKINNSKQSTMMNIIAPNTASMTAHLPPLNTSAALRQGDLLFAQVSQNIGGSQIQSANNSIQYNPLRQNPLLMQEQAHQYDSLISQQQNQFNQNHHNDLGQIYSGQQQINLHRPQTVQNNQNAHNGYQSQINQTLHFTEQKPPQHHNLELLSDRFTSAEKNSRIFLTAGGPGTNGSLNSARGGPGVQRSSLILDDTENIEPNRVNLAQQRLPLHSQNSNQKPLMSQNRSLRQLEQPHTLSHPINVEMNQELSSHNTSIQLPLSRPPLANQDRSMFNAGNGNNSFKRPQSVRSGSAQNIGRLGANGYEDSLDGGNSSVQGDFEDKDQYPIRNSLKQRLNQVKNVFSAIRKNLEDQTDSKIEDNLL